MNIFCIHIYIFIMYYIKSTSSYAILSSILLYYYLRDCTV